MEHYLLFLKLIVAKNLQPFLSTLTSKTLFATSQIFKNLINGYIFLQLNKMRIRQPKQTAKHQKGFKMLRSVTKSTASFNTASSTSGFSPIYSFHSFLFSLCISHYLSLQAHSNPNSSEKSQERAPKICTTVEPNAKELILIRA